MNKENNLREELLKQMEKNHGRAPSIDPTSVQAIVTKEMGRVRRMKRVTAISWFLLAASCVIAAITGAVLGFHNETWLVSSVLGIQALLIIAVACAISLYFMRRSLKMEQIQATLSDIQEQLRKISQDK